MALSQSITIKDNFDEELTFTDAYIKVASVTATTEECSILLNTHKNKDSVVIKTETYSFVPDLEGDNFIMQAYNHIKKLSLFSCAVDC